MISLDRNDLLFQNSRIKKEADKILYVTGLVNILQSFGNPHISGSYDLDLMTWRDLDIYLETENITETEFFRMGSEICNLLQPVKMSYRNELIGKTNGLPAGLYWGIYLGNERAGAWKIDLWAIDSKECQRLIEYCSMIKEKLSPENILPILEIKSQCWKDPGYRRIFNSSDIYDAVIEHGIKSLEEFKEYLLSS